VRAVATIDDNTATPPTGELLVGRDQELATFEKILQDKQAQLVVLTGGPGVGKTSLLRKFLSLAEAAGWNTTKLPDSIRIDQEATPDSFSTQLQAVLSVPSTKSFIEKRSTPSVDSGQPLLPIVERLSALAPFLLTIDGYRPGAEFGQWFEKTFLNDVKRSAAVIVIILAERPESATKMTPVADQIIQLGPLDDSSIRQHFMELGHKISPPMSEMEIEEYTKAAQEDTEVLERLTRVLRLALPGPNDADRPNVTTVE
jgi:hypothetical protein